MVVGEGRPFLSALVVPDLDVLALEANARDLPTGPREQMLAEPALLSLFDDAFAAYNAGAASHERVRTYRFAPEPFTVDNDLMTPTMKLKRRLIEDRFAQLVETMYESDR